MTCGTGEVVVFHDDDLVRLGQRPERIADTSFAVLRAAKLTSGARIPTLEEVFEACGPEMLVNMELKVPNRGPAVAPLVDGVAAIVARTGTGARVLVSSFHPLAVRSWMRRSRPSPRACCSSANRRCRCGGPGRRRCCARSRSTPRSCSARAERVSAWQRRGYMVNVWTVDDAAAIAACRRMRVDGIITNDPPGPARWL